jgi:hypothetical protein
MKDITYINLNLFHHPEMEIETKRWMRKRRSRRKREREK